MLILHWTQENKIQQSLKKRRNSDPVILEEPKLKKSCFVKEIKTAPSTPPSTPAGSDDDSRPVDLSKVRNKTKHIFKNE
jgi:hypothetical protein